MAYCLTVSLGVSVYYQNNVLGMTTYFITAYLVIAVYLDSTTYLDVMTYLSIKHVCTWK